MKALFTLLLATCLALPAFAQTADELTDEFVEYAAGAPRSALDYAFQYGENWTNNQRNSLNGRVSSLLAQSGQALSAEVVFKQKLGSHLQRAVILIQCTEAPIFIAFTLYESSYGWIFSEISPSNTLPDYVR